MRGPAGSCTSDAKESWPCPAEHKLEHKGHGTTQHTKAKPAYDCNYCLLFDKRFVATLTVHTRSTRILAAHKLENDCVFGMRAKPELRKAKRSCFHSLAKARPLSPNPPLLLPIIDCVVASTPGRQPSAGNKKHPLSKLLQELPRRHK